MSYILFYSNYCKYSHKFINILEKSGEASFFAKICVDKDPRTGKRPPVIQKYNIKEVPTVIVENQKLEGYKAFSWLQSRIENSQDQVNSLQSRQNKQSVNLQQLNQNNEATNKIEAYATKTNFIDNFVELSGNNNSTTIYTPSSEEDIKSKKGNFILPDDNITSVAMSAPELSSQHGGGVNQLSSISISKDKLKTKQFDNEFNKLMAERDSCTPKQPQRI